ncbi:TOG array regulator of axonemal microtubules protein 1 isoform X1 [Brienomyrus brachyistius]|uniref:TOG array regulator of axonemal microtubules protein 1 isoform X1 n=1 Tax=Brienomyrus brachyistius TaxID=42636 RepID=UPI0020B45053|nr:TOG array regulator of axonemal microtubules protein 1 isoform X1 [Brienomyrus brachyistius]
MSDKDKREQEVSAPPSADLRPNSRRKKGVVCSLEIQQDEIISSLNDRTEGKRLSAIGAVLSHLKKHGGRVLFPKIKDILEALTDIFQKDDRKNIRKACVQLVSELVSIPEECIEDFRIDVLPVLLNEVSLADNKNRKALLQTLLKCVKFSAKPYRVFQIITKHALLHHENGIRSATFDIYPILLKEESQNLNLSDLISSLSCILLGNKESDDPFVAYVTLNQIKLNIGPENFNGFVNLLPDYLLRVYSNFEEDHWHQFLKWGIPTSSQSPEHHEEAKNGKISFSQSRIFQFLKYPVLRKNPKLSAMMMFEIVPQELHKQLLDLKNYQNRINGVDELKSILFDLDLKQVSSDNIEEFISFLRRLLDDTNFKVFYGTLQVMNLVIEKLALNVDKYLKQIVCAALRTLGDTRVIARIEYMSIFRQLMRIVGPQKVLDLVIGQLKHKNSRVREDVINIIIAGMLTHPRKDFNIPSLCYEVAPCLADSKKKVRHAALELFAVFDYCLDNGKKQPLLRAIDRVELNGDAEGLAVAIQTRRARHILPRLSPDGMVEYALVVPRPGQRGLPQFSSGADLDWVMDGCRVNSGRSHQTEPELDRPCDGTLGGLTEVFPQHRRIVSAGKGKNRFPWERMGLPATMKPLTGKDFNSKSSAQFQVLSKGCPPPALEYGQESHVCEPDCHLPRITGRKEPVRVPPKTGNVDLDPCFLESASPSDRDAGDHACDRHSPRHSSSSLRRFSSGSHRRSRGELVSTSPTPVRRAPSHDALRPTSEVPSTQECLYQDLSQRGMLEEEEEIVDREEIMKSLRCLRFSAAKKRAKMSLNGSDPDQEQDPDSPDSAVKLELGPESPSRTSPPLTSPLSESGLSSLYSPPASTNKGSKTSSGSSSSSVVKPKPRAARASTKTRAASSRERAPLHGSHAVNVVGQRVVYSNVSPEPEMNLRWESSPSSCGPRGRAPVKAVRPTGASLPNSRRVSPTSDLSDGIIGKGVSCTPLSSPQGVSLDCGDSRWKSRNEAQRNPHDACEYPNSQKMEKMTLSSSADDMLLLSQKEQEFLQMGMEYHQIQKLLHQMPPEFSPEEIREWQQNGNTAVKAKPESPSESLLATPYSLACQSSPPLKPHPPFRPHPPNRPSLTNDSPAHQPVLPIQPSPPIQSHKPKASRPTRLRKAFSLKTQSTFSHSSDDLSPGKQNLQPIPRPDQALTDSLSLLSSEDWEKKIEGLELVRRLAQFHTELMSDRLHDTCLVVIDEVKNLRSGVSRVAVATLGELFTHMKREMDPELDYTVKVLLHKSGETNAFLRQDVDMALASMVQNCTPVRVMNALLAGGLNHLNTVVRKCTAQHLADLVEIMGAERLLSSRELTDRILPAVAKLAHDSSQETRHFGRQMLLFLASHKDFDKLLERHIPDKEVVTVKNTVLSLRKKEMGGASPKARSVTRRHSLNGGTARTLSLSREPSSLKQDPDGYYCKGQASNFADKTEYIKKLNALMLSKDFRERIRALEQLVSDCEQNPDMVIVNLFPVFDAIKARLQESNSKVNLSALQCLQKIIAPLKDQLAQVVSLLVPAIVDNHLNSKNNAIYSTAIGVIHALMENIDNTLLLQPFCTKAQFLGGKAKVDLIIKVADLVYELYPRKPQVVEQKALPLLWYLLGTSSKGASLLARGCSVSAATAVLCQALHSHMGPSLAECASSQHPNVYKSFNRLLKSISSH